MNPQTQYDDKLHEHLGNQEDSAADTTQPSGESSTATSSEELGQNEARPELPSSSAQDNDSDMVGNGFQDDGDQAKKGSRLKRARKFIKTTKGRIALGVIGGGGGAVAIALIVLLFVASSLKIPDLAQHITEYQFSRLTRQYAQNADRVTQEKLALEAADD